jgi:hypothetical protein
MDKGLKISNEIFDQKNFFSCNFVQFLVIDSEPWNRIVDLALNDGSGSGINEFGSETLITNRPTFLFEIF